MILTSNPEFPETSTQLKGKAARKIQDISQKGVGGISVSSSSREFELSHATIAKSATMLPPSVKSSIDDLIRVMEKVSLRQMDSLKRCVIEPSSGIRIEQDIKVSSSMSVSSSGQWDNHNLSALAGILCNARVCNVPERTAILEPDNNGGLSPLSIYTAHMSGATRILRLPQIDGMIGISLGWFGNTPETILSTCEHGLEKEVQILLSKRNAMPQCDICIAADSNAGSRNIADMIIETVSEYPELNLLFVSSSKRICNKVIQHIEEQSDKASPWKRDLDKLQYTILQDTDAIVNFLNKFVIKRLLLLTNSIEYYSKHLNHVSHIISGDTFSIGTSIKAISAGSIIPDINTDSGVFKFLRTVTLETLDNRAGLRFQNIFRNIDKI
ncbi:MAG: histidinol dehydrogenase [Deltaproteobacteria bacterium]|nr:histidinol dehydrogenase [Deltaproteobacteria bacterium]